MYIRVFLNTSKTFDLFTFPNDEFAFLLLFPLCVRFRFTDTPGKAWNSREQQITYLIRIHPEAIKTCLKNLYR